MVTSKESTTRPERAGSMSEPRRPQPELFPFIAIEGCELAKLALSLLLVDRRLNGLLIGSGPGTAKSLLVRSVQTIAPASRHGIDSCEAHYHSPLPVVDLPSGATEDSLIGGLDLELTLATGKRQPAAGLLARADGGALVVDDLNLLDASLVDHIAAALDSGVVRVEREGISASHPARFLLLGTYDPAAGEVAPLLRDRVGLLVETEPLKSSEERVGILALALEYEEDRRAVIERYAKETAAIKKRIARARSLVESVILTREDARKIAAAALSLGVEGNRADLFAVRVARASAALDGREYINEDDLVTAIKLVLLPRATVAPDIREGLKEPAGDGAPDLREDQSGAREGEKNDRRPLEDAPGKIEELILKARDAETPRGVLTLAQVKKRRPSSGNRAQASPAARGRYVRSAERATGDRRVAIDATLRAAAPFQLFRHAQSLLTQSAGTRKDRKVKVTAGDLRFKKFKRRAGMLIIFAVDASGSMALNRMAQAKGAIIRLLENAYLHRDKVALVSFRGKEARTLLAPTRSVALARSLVDALPAGGSTPVAAGLAQALELARFARVRGDGQALLVVLTDGRANVGLTAESDLKSGSRARVIRDEIERLGAELLSEGVSSIVIDTRLSFHSGGEGLALAGMLGGRYTYLPRADASAIYDSVTGLVAEARKDNRERESR